MSWVLSGAGGFLGRGLLPALLRRGEKLSLLGRDPASLQRLLPEGQRCLCYDLAEGRAPEGLAAGDTVIHMAALLGNARVAREEYLRVNTRGTLQLARAAIEAGAATFLFMSTVSAHGPIGSAESPLREESPFRPVSLYGESKARAEEQLAALDWGETRPLVLRPGVIFGPDPNPHSSAARLFRMMAGPRYLQAGGGRSYFNVIHREQLVAALLHLVDAPVGGSAWPGPAYLVREDPCPTMAQVQGWIQQAIGHQGRRIPLPTGLLSVLGALGDGLRGLGLSFPLSRETVAGFSGSGYYSSIDKLKATGWRPVADARSGILSSARAFHGQ
ncbi:MAG: NAD-dependent epimerase/dehydratase family protein [Thermomicrobiales bacterium]|nr:NAD-dependent epimerase/dehydratase family protein [Thermomicrobiales bacterium]